MSIERFIQASLFYSNDVLVVDRHSPDTNADLAKGAGARVILDYDMSGAWLKTCLSSAMNSGMSRVEPESK